jgi:hypothetical protein
MRNLQVAGAMALDPNSQYDPQKIADLQVRLMDLPVNPESLKKDWVTGVMQMASALVQTGIDPQQALMIGGQDLVQEKQAMEQGRNLGQLDERTLGQGPDGNTTALAGAPRGAPGAGPEQFGGMPDMG